MSGIWLTIKKEKKFLIALLFISFFIRALFFHFFTSREKHYFFCDSDVYTQVGEQIADGNGILRADGTHNFMRVPGYSFFLAAMYKLFGKNDVKALWVQVLLASFIPLLIFCLSLALFPTKMLLAKVVSAFSSFHLGYVLFSGVLMSEALFCIFFFLFLILFLSGYSLFFCKKNKQNNYIRLFLASVFLGVASLIRPVGNYLIVLLIIMLLFSNAKFLDRCKQSTALFFGWLLIVFGWLLRNYLLTGFIFFHSWGGFHFLHYTAAPIYMQMSGKSFRQSSVELCVNQWGDRIKKEEKAKKRKLSKIEKSYIGEKLAISYMKKRPWLAIKNGLYNIFKTCAALYSSDLLMITSGYPECCYDSSSPFVNMLKRFFFPPVKNNFLRIIIWMEILFFFIILLGFSIRLLQSLFDIKLLCVVLKFLPIMALMLFISLACGFARLRLPIEPFLIILAFDFWLNFFKKRAWL